MKTLAGISMSEANRLSTDSTLVDEVLSSIRRVVSRRGTKKADMFGIIRDVTENTGTSQTEVQSALDEAYKNRYISIDKDGYVSIINASRARKNARRITASTVHLSQLQELVYRVECPAWVEDRDIWKKAVHVVPVESAEYWNKVASEYRRFGGRILADRKRTAEIKPRPFDVHPPLWVLSAGGDIDRNNDIQLLQSMIASTGADDVENQLVQAGATPVLARKLVEKALVHPPLI